MSGWELQVQLWRTRPWLMVAEIGVVALWTILLVILVNWINYMLLVHRTHGLLPATAKSQISALRKIIRILKREVFKLNDQIKDMAGAISGSRERLSQNWVIRDSEKELAEHIDDEEQLRRTI